jgi:hypothetical protein
VVERFKLSPRPGFAGQLTQLTTADVAAVPATNGPFALFEFTGALPRTRLYRRWQVATNDQAALSQVVSASFDPEQSVLVERGAPAARPAGAGVMAEEDLPAAPPAGVSPEAGTVQFVSYAARDIVLKADAAAPSVLLLNDRFHPDWNVRVDGKPAKLLRCNYIMRGVYLTPGVHRVEFRFQPSYKTFYISLAGLSLGLLLLGFVTVSGLLSWARVPPAATGSGPQAPRGQGDRKNRRDRSPAAGARSAGK